MQLQYYFESKSHTLYDNQYRVELWRKDYLGGAIEIENGASEPFNIDYPDTGSNFNVYYPIWGSNFSFTFVQQHNCTLENILTDDERTIKLIFYRNGFIEWTGWVVPDLCSDSVNNKNYFVTVKATDGLGLLKDINILTEAVDIPNIPNSVSNWNWSNQVITTTITQTQKSILEIIKICLDKIELDLGIEIDNDLFETSLGSDERVFEKVLVDYQIYQSSGKSYSCLDTISSLLTSLNAIIVQSEGKWIISRINYLESRFIIRERYDNQGVYLESKEIDNQLDLTYHNSNTHKSWYWLYDGHSRILRNPYRFKNFIYEYKEPVNLISDSWYFITDSLNIPTSFTNGEDTVITKIPRTNKLPIIRIQNNDKFMYDNLHPFTTLNIFKTGLLLPEIEILSKLEYELTFDIIADLFFMYFEFTSNGVKYYWNINENFWKTSYHINDENELKAIIQKRNGFTKIVGNDRGGYDTYSTQGTITIKLPNFPTNGTLKVWVKGGESTRSIQNTQGNSIPVLRNYIDYINVKLSSSNGLVKETHSFENVKKVSFSAEDSTVFNGDGFQNFYSRSNFTLKDTNYQTTKLWKDSTSQEPTNLLAFSARSIINNYSKRRTVIQGTLKSNEKIKIGSLLSFDSYDKLNDKKLLVIPPLSFNPCSDEYEVTLFELSCGSAEGLLSEYYLDSSEFPLYENIVPYAEIVCDDFIGLNEGRFFEFGIFQDNQLWIEIEGEGIIDNSVEGRFFEFGVAINDNGWIEVEGEGEQDEFFQISNLFVLENLFVSDTQTLLVLDITNVIIEKTSTIKATVIVNNPSNLLLEYSLDNSTYQTSNIFEGLYSTNKFYIRVVSDNSIIRTFTKVETIDTNNFALNSLDNKTRKLAPTTNDILNISHFAITPQKTYLDSTNYIRPVWAVWWDNYHNSFTQYNLKAWNVGLAGLIYGGQTNADPAKQGIDYQDSDYYNFVSAIPYQNRGHNQYNVSYGDEPWYSGSLEQIYDMGTEIGQSNLLGGGDNVDNRTLRGIVMSDIENSDENGSIKHRVFLISATRKTKGYYSSIYGCVFITLGYTEDSNGQKMYYNYPDENGNYASNANISQDWLLSTRTTLLSRNIDNESLLDYPNILPSTEYSLYYEMVSPQGSKYPLDNNGNYINVNKFGSNKTVMNPLCGLGYNMEIQAWYCRYKLNNRRNIFLPKMLADKGSLIGRNEYSKNYDGTYKPDSIIEHTNKNIGRKYAFLFTLLGFANGLDLEIWDRSIYADNNINGGIDTYSGVLGVIEMLTNNGAIEKYNDLVPEYWNTEYSLDNGITWLKTKAIDWDKSSTDLLPVRITKSDNFVVLTAFRPEGIEPTNFIARTIINEEYKYFNVNQDNWQTTDYEYKDTTDLSLIPLSYKHYYCQVFNF